MKKIELKNMAEFFGNRIQAARIKDRETRLSIVRLYASLAAAYKPVADEVESIRVSLVGDKSEEIGKWGSLVERSHDSRLTDQEREEARKEAESMDECIRINDDFRDAAAKVYNEEADVDIKKVPFEVLYEALCDCGVAEEWPLAAIANDFATVIE